MSTHYRFVVQGRVQGVGFRQATMTQAQRLGLHGWVTNRADGSVEGEVSHERDDLLADFHRWLHRGPVMARVEAVEWIESPAAAPLTAGFSIRR